MAPKHLKAVAEMGFFHSPPPPPPPPPPFHGGLGTLSRGMECRSGGIGFPMEQEKNKRWGFQGFSGEQEDQGEEGDDGSHENDQPKLCARGHWRLVKDAKLKELVSQYGPQNWNLIAEKIEGKETPSPASLPQPTSPPPPSPSSFSTPRMSLAVASAQTPSTASSSIAASTSSPLGPTPSSTSPASKLPPCSIPSSSPLSPPSPPSPAQVTSEHYFNKHK